MEFTCCLVVEEEMTYPVAGKDDNDPTLNRFIEGWKKFLTESGGMCCGGFEKNGLVWKNARFEKGQHVYPVVGKARFPHPLLPFEKKVVGEKARSCGFKVLSCK
jgi:hypothetical protein